MYKADEASQFFTPLPLATWGGHVEVMRLLLSAAEIDVNRADKFGMTPLPCAGESGFAESTELLVAAPGDRCKSSRFSWIDASPRSVQPRQCEGGANSLGRSRD